MAKIKFSQQLFDDICARMAEGESLRSICAAKGTPNRVTVYDWRDLTPENKQQFVRAREIGFDVIAENLRETARKRGDSSGEVDRDKLIIETDLKLLKSWDPKRFGDRTALVGGGEGDAPIAVVGDFSGAVLAHLQAKHSDT